MEAIKIVTIVVGLIAVLYSIWCIFKLIKFKKEELICRVKETSVLYKKIIEVNKSYKFHNTIESEYIYCHSCSSKRVFDRTNLKILLMERIEEGMVAFEQLFQKVKENSELYKKYKDQIHYINSKYKSTTTNGLKVKLSKYLKIENEVCFNALLRPQCTTSVKYSVKYVSPKGRNSYNRNEVFSFSEIENLYHETQKNINGRSKLQNQIRNERSKMTDSLRYDVMKRDNFKCQLCGASAKDGVILHVDHIFPVSKGGRTEMSNLRTLCDRCNLGKRDKIE